MLKIFDQISRKKIILKIKKNKNIKIYVCGLTPYYHSHIGHARTFLFFDIIIRCLNYLGYKTTYIRNITDIDDKIFNESNKKNINYKCLTKFYIKEYNKLFKILNIKKPNFEPKVTNYINEIINFIKILIKNNNAYIDKNGDVLFNIKNNKNYGFLSNRDILNKEKKNFTLWKVHKKKNNLWNSPWGFGRPGWHIECSSIINFFFKNKLDFHGGGMDLLFPHNENELSILSSVNKNFKINNWINIGSVNFLKKKMSKSLNNYIKLKNIIKNFDSNSIRLYLTKKYYRKPIEFDFKILLESQKSLNKIYKNISELNLNKNNKKLNTEFTKEFIKYIKDDFNTTKIYSIFFYMNKEINKYKNNKIISTNIGIELKNLMSIIGIIF